MHNSVNYQHLVKNQDISEIVKSTAREFVNDGPSDVSGPTNGKITNHAQDPGQGQGQGSSQAGNGYLDGSVKTSELDMSSVSKTIQVREAAKKVLRPLPPPPPPLGGLWKFFFVFY